MTAPLEPRETPTHGWRGWLREAFTERLSLKALALLLAVVLWLIVNAGSRGGGVVR